MQGDEQHHESLERNQYTLSDGIHEGTDYTELFVL